MSTELFDVIAVRIDDGTERKMNEAPLTERNAEAVVNLAVMRRGVDVEFYKAVPHARPPADG